MVVFTITGVHQNPTASLHNNLTIYKYYFVTYFFKILTQWLLEIKRKGGHLNQLYLFVYFFSLANPPQNMNSFEYLTSYCELQGHLQFSDVCLIG